MWGDKLTRLYIVIFLTYTFPDTAVSMGYVTPPSSVYSYSVRINPIRCSEDDIQLHKCEEFGIQYNDVPSNFVGVSCNDFWPSKLQNINLVLMHLQWRNLKKDNVF